MKRIKLASRTNWQEAAEKIGFTYHTCGQTPDNIDGAYWDESIAYEFNESEILAIEAATNELHARCLEAVDIIIRQDLMGFFDIPKDWQNYIRQSWEQRHPSIMGRFDLAYNPTTGAIKMLEYNADTPTLVIETSLMQWFWLQDCYPQMDQFNSLHEKLLDAFGNIKQFLSYNSIMHFAALPEYPEEMQHIKYYMDLAQQRGITAKFISMHEIGYSPIKGFVDLDNVAIRFMHKLYPWEWMMNEEFGKYIVDGKIGVIEPVWKMLLSNKNILPIMWELFKDHPNLLPAYFDNSKFGSHTSYIEKPVLGREGANMQIIKNGTVATKTAGSYGQNKFIYQALAELPVFDEQYVVIGSWIVNNDAAGMIIREDAKPIVVNTSKIVPHYFVPE